MQRKRERESETDRQTGRQRDSDRQRQRDGERQRKAQKEQKSHQLVPTSIGWTRQICLSSILLPGKASDMFPEKNTKCSILYSVIPLRENDNVKPFKWNKTDA